MTHCRQQEMDKAIANTAMQEPFTMLRRLNETLLEQFPILISTVARHFESQLMTMKIAGKDAEMPLQRNQPAAIDQ